MRALKDRVKESLARLERENYVARQGDTYSFLTDEEQEIAQEIARTPIDNAQVIESIKKRLFDSIYTARKLNRGANDFPFDRYVDGSIHGTSMGGMELCDYGERPGPCGRYRAGLGFFGQSHRGLER